MSIIAEFTAPSNSLVLGQCIENQSGAEIEIERIVPMRQGTFPYIFVWNHTNYDLFEETANALPGITSVTIIEKFDDGRLYKLSWEEQEHQLISNIVRNDGVLLFARGDSDRWKFELRFPKRANVSQFFKDRSELMSLSFSKMFRVRQLILNSHHCLKKWILNRREMSQYSQPSRNTHSKRHLRWGTSIRPEMYASVMLQPNLIFLRQPVVYYSDVVTSNF